MGLALSTSPSTASRRSGNSGLSEDNSSQIVRDDADADEPKRWYRSSFRGKQHVQSECTNGAAKTRKTLKYRMNVVEIASLFSRYAVDNTVMITICDKGYLDVFRKFYHLNKMEQYTNFVAVVLDEAGYDVCSMRFLHSFYV